METSKIAVGSLFGGKIQFKIPLFQRHYVWDREGQWQPLWEDIKEKSERRLSDPQKDTLSHFTGVIVVQRINTLPGQVEKFQIIDGQQRLTTFQIILCALRDICKQQNFDDLAETIEDDYLLNKGKLIEGEDKYKLVPTDFDKNSLLKIVDCEASSPNKSKIHDAYKYFQTAIQEYAGNDKKKIDSLYEAVLGNFGLVQILVDKGKDDAPEIIFESLNARGKNLLEFDLIRNNLFMRTSDNDRDALYKKYWKHFETEDWEKEVGVGKNKLALSELFLQHFLMAKLGEHDVSPLFRTYQRRYRVKLPENKGIEHELAELHRYSEKYQIITDCDKESDIGSLMRFYRIFDITSLRPFILYLLNDSGLDDSKESKKDILLTLRILESYTIRRMLCTRNGHKNYNQFFSGIIRELISKKSKFSVREFAGTLSRQEADTSKWPNNDDVKKSLSGSWISVAAKTAAKNIMRYVLYRIELLTREESRFPEKGELPFGQFTLEHIMPEKWEEKWLLPNDNGFLSRKNLYSKELEPWEVLSLGKEYLADPAYLQAHELTVERYNSLQNIGNLTIVTKGLNSSMNNDSYDKKRKNLFSDSTLMLNKEISKSASWDVKEIKERGDLLCEKFCQIWRDSKWFEENIT